MTQGNVRIRLAMGMGTLFAVAGMTMMACGGDDTTVMGGPDAGVDGTAPGDGAPPVDATTDGSSHDGSADGGDGGDGGPGTTDGSTDGGGDGGDSGSTDAGDSGLPDNSALLSTFQTELATLVCSKLAAECTALSAGTVNQASCVQENTRASPVLQGSTYNYANTQATSRRDIIYSPGEAVGCISDVQALTLTNLTSAAWKKAINDCFLVGQGTLEQGGFCFQSLECAPNLYCKTGAGDAGALDAGPDGGAPPTGACEPLESAGAVCTAYPAGDSCAYLGGLNSTYCEFTLDPANNDEYCMAGLVADGQPCLENVDCASALCDLHSNVCVETTTDLTTLCTAYK